MSELLVIELPNGQSDVRRVALNNAINDETGDWFPLRTMNDELPEGFRLCTIEDIAKKDAIDDQGKPLRYKIVPEHLIDMNAYTADPGAYEYNENTSSSIKYNEQKKAAPETNKFSEKTVAQQIQFLRSQLNAISALVENVAQSIPGEKDARSNL